MYSSIYLCVNISDLFTVRKADSPWHLPHIPRAWLLQGEGRRRAGSSFQRNQGLLSPRQGGRLLSRDRFHCWSSSPAGKYYCFFFFVCALFHYCLVWLLRYWGVLRFFLLLDPTFRNAMMNCVKLSILGRERAVPNYKFFISKWCSFNRVIITCEIN